MTLPHRREPLCWCGMCWLATPSCDGRLFFANGNDNDTVFHTRGGVEDVGWVSLVV